MFKALPIATRASLAVLLFLFALPFFATAQTASSEKNKVFKVKIITPLKAADAQNLDAKMLERKGILECKTDAATGYMTVKVISQIDYYALQTVINYYGYETNSEDVTVKDE